MAAKGSRKNPAAAKVPPVEPARHNGPRGIAGLIAPVLRPALKRRGAALAALVADWSSIVGPEVAARSQPVKFAAGTLTIGCAGPDALEFQHLAPTLIARINLALGGAPVERLRFADLAVTPATSPARPAARTAVAGEPPRLPAHVPPDLPGGPLGEALARLHEGLGGTMRERKG